MSLFSWLSGIFVGSEVANTVTESMGDDSIIDSAVGFTAGVAAAKVTKGIVEEVEKDIDFLLSDGLFDD